MGAMTGCHNNGRRSLTAAFSCPVCIRPLSPNFDLQIKSILPTDT